MNYKTAKGTLDSDQSSNYSPAEWPFSISHSIIYFKDQKEQLRQ